MARKSKRDMRDCIVPPNDGRFHCLRGCGDSWDNDPRLSVPCPSCNAKAGVMCKRPSEHTLSGQFRQPCKARLTAAFEAHPCGCLAKWDAEHSDPQQSLFAKAVA